MHVGQTGSGRGLLGRFLTAVRHFIQFWASPNAAGLVPLPIMVRRRAERRPRAFSAVILLTVAVSMISGCAGGWQGSASANSGQTSITQPQSQTVTLGQTATFAVSASGSGPFTYQWLENGVPISGATSSTYTTAATAMNDSGAVFTVVVTGPTGPVTSAGATLTVKAVPPAITTQPVSQTVLA